MATVSLCVTIATDEGEVLDRLIVTIPSNGKGTSRVVAANAIRDLIEHRFEVEDED